MPEIDKIKHINSKETKAILIGVSEFEDKSFVNAPPIKNNVEKLAAILQDENILGLPENRILLLNKNESHRVILHKIRDFVGDKSEYFADTVIFYFAGHGYKTDNDDFFLVTQNTDKEDIDITSIPWKKIKDILEKGNGIQQRLYILDACHSGAAALGENDTETDIAEGSLLIAAANADKKSYFNSTDQYTYFTNALINILENGIDKTDAQQIDTESLFDNLDKLLRDKKFEIRKKATHKIERVSFFKNVKFDNEIEKIREIEEEIEKATNLIFEKQYKTARLILKGLQSEIETLKNKEKLLKTINRKIEDCKFLPRYHKEIEIHFKKFIQEKETQISQLSDDLKNNKSTISKLKKQLQETEKQLAENKENVYEIKQLTIQKENLQKQLESETQNLQIQTKKASELETQIDKLAKEDKEIYDKLLSKKKALEQQLAKKNKEIGDKDKQITDLNKQLNEKETKIDILEKEIEEHKIELYKLKNPPKQKIEKTSNSNFTQKIGNNSFNMIYLKGGTFEMGSNDGYDDEKPIHSVTIPDFYIAEFQVTQKLWREVMGNNPSNFKGEYNPVEKVSWYDAVKFCNKLSEKTGKNYRLPSEAEWEYVARGGVETHSRASHKYAGSNNIDEVAWYDKNSGSKTHPVGEKKPNELGIYDMSGNVWEWCQDKWYDNYENAPANGSAWGIGNSSNRVLRGGSWNNNARSCRVANRISSYPTDGSGNIGFRIALSL